MAQLVAIASIDNAMSQVNPDTNHGAAAQIDISVLYAGETKVQWTRSIGNFNVGAIAGATIHSAKLVRNIVQVINPSELAKVSRCTRPATWVESECTWNDYSSGNAWTNAGGDFDDTGPPAVVEYTEAATTGTHEITGLAAFVTDALDNRSGIVSIILRLTDEDPGTSVRYVFHSKDEATEDDRWRLVVDYTPAVVSHHDLMRGRWP